MKIIVNNLHVLKIGGEKEISDLGQYAKHIFEIVLYGLITNSMLNFDFQKPAHPNLHLGMYSYAILRTLLFRQQN